MGLISKTVHVLSSNNRNTAAREKKSLLGREKFQTVFRTWCCRVKSANPTSVLCRPPASFDLLHDWDSFWSTLFGCITCAQERPKRRCLVQMPSSVVRLHALLSKSHFLLPIIFNHTFCSTGLPLVSIRWVLMTFSSFCSKQCRQ